MVLSPQSYTRGGTQVQPNCCCPRPYYDWYRCWACAELADSYGQMVPRRLAVTLRAVENSSGNSPLCDFCSRANRTFIVDFAYTLVIDPGGSHTKVCRYFSPLVSPGPCTNAPYSDAGMRVVVDLAKQTGYPPYNSAVSVSLLDSLAFVLLSGTWLHPLNVFAPVMRCNDTTELGPSEIYPREFWATGNGGAPGAPGGTGRSCNMYFDSGLWRAGPTRATVLIELVTR